MCPGLGTCIHRPARSIPLEIVVRGRGMSWVGSRRVALVLWVAGIPRVSLVGGFTGHFSVCSARRSRMLGSVSVSDGLGRLGKTAWQLFWGGWRWVRRRAWVEPGEKADPPWVLSTCCFWFQVGSRHRGWMDSCRAPSPLD